MDVSDNTGAASSTVRCTHGKRPSAIGCAHRLADSGAVVGFVENCSDPDNLQAWCAAREKVFIVEGDMTARFLEFNRMAVVCDLCYSHLKDRHGLPAGD
jgi:hypothetical protein